MKTLTLTALSLGAALTLAAPAPAAAQNLENVVKGVAQSLINQELDKAAYIEAQNTNTEAAYRAYLARYPSGIYRGNAQQQLARLGASVTQPPSSTSPTPPAGTSAAAIEASLNLSRSQRVLIQRQLTLIGYDTRGADGLWGSLTRGALTRWQTANGYTGTGYITGAQVNRIADQARAKGGTTTTTPAPGTSTDAALEERLLSLTATERRQIQLRLTLLGYDTYGADGVFGRNSRAAIARWQGDHGDKATGYITADQIRTLQSEARG